MQRDFAKTEQMFENILKCKWEYNIMLDRTCGIFGALRNVKERMAGGV